MPSLGKMLARAREAAGLTQGEVARKLDLASGQAVSNWERGVNVLEGPHLSALIDLYEMDETAALLA